MSSEERPEVSRLSRAFGPLAEAYDRGRPSFPADAARWLVGRDAATVLELGAGTGKLTRELVALGHDVHASDPDPGMLAVLKRHLPDVPTSECTAEDIPLPDRSVDVVVAGQAFHWFDTDRALPEIARVLKPGGAVAVAWNNRDAKIPWVRKLWALLGEQPTVKERTDSAVDALVTSPLFGYVDRSTFSHWQEINRSSIVDLVASRSYVAALDEPARAAKLAEVLDFYDDYGRGMDGMQLAYECECFRAVVADRAESDPSDEDGSGDGNRDGDDPGGASDGTDTEMLLIDFR
ncbi:class I SAM-dependent methyltransferase [Nocardioides sp.]|uniref:class I SAM-dependent methyltransferase n=1 Tax=Nocardioides sp. TaxID=35761 RepID=UPI002ED08218